jgi:hypothetical protein
VDKFEESRLLRNLIIIVQYNGLLNAIVAEKRKISAENLAQDRPTGS